MKLIYLNLLLFYLIVLGFIGINISNEIVNNINNKVFSILLPYFGLCCLLLLLIANINFWIAILKFSYKDIFTLMQYTKIIKIGLIPFWIMNIIKLMNKLSNEYIIDYLPIIITLYIILIISSEYSILYLILLFQKKLINIKQLILFIIAQLIFIIDIIIIISIFKNIKISIKAHNGT